MLVSEKEYNPETINRRNDKRRLQSDALQIKHTIMEKGESMENVVVWGTGNIGTSEFYISLLKKEYNILGYCDSDKSKWKQSVNGYVVLTEKELTDAAEKNLGRILVAVADETVFFRIRDKIEKLNLPDRVKVSWYKNLYFDLVKKNMEALRPVKAYEEKDIDFRKQTETWLDNLMSEVEFWTEIVAKPKARNRDDYEKRLQNRKFTSELTQNTERVEDYLKDKQGALVYDIGCGLAPRFGTQLASGKVIQLTGIDPLAYFYNVINRKFASVPCREIVFGMFEFLSKFINKNMADVVIVNNALDHCIDPFRSIVECLRILKAGGMLHMNHGRMEGLVGLYQGLHQWNMDYNEKGDFIIWNYDVMINVSERLKDIAEVQVYYSDQQISLDEQYVCVEIIKKKEFSMADIINMDNDDAELAFMVKKMMEIISNPDFNLRFKNMLVSS